MLDYLLPCLFQRWKQEFHISLLGKLLGNKYCCCNFLTSEMAASPFPDECKAQPVSGIISGVGICSLGMLGLEMEGARWWNSACDGGTNQVSILSHPLCRLHVALLWDVKLCRVVTLLSSTSIRELQCWAGSDTGDWRASFTLWSNLNFSLLG